MRWNPTASSSATGRFPANLAQWEAGAGIVDIGSQKGPCRLSLCAVDRDPNRQDRRTQQCEGASTAPWAQPKAEDSYDDETKDHHRDGSPLVDGDIGLASTAAAIVDTALKRFGSIDALVNNAGIFFSKPLTEYTLEDFRALSSTNLDGFIHTTQLAVKQMLSQNSGGSVVSITHRRSSACRVHRVFPDDYQRRY